MQRNHGLSGDRKGILNPIANAKSQNKLCEGAEFQRSEIMPGRERYIGEVES